MYVKICANLCNRYHLSYVCELILDIQGISISLSARILHRAPPPRLEVDQNFLTQKIVADLKMRCHQKSFGIWRVTEAILGQKTCFFPKNIFWKKIIINHTIFKIFRYAFYRYQSCNSEKTKISPKMCLYLPEKQP